MWRTIVEPADVFGDALNDLKSWLGITRPNEDGQLAGLLGSALTTCEAFTGQAPIAQLVEERVPVHRAVSVLSSRPVRNFEAAEIVNLDNTRSALEPQSYEFRPNSDGTAQFSLNRSVEGQAIAVQFRAGIAENWLVAPGPIKHGVIRLCAFQYRARDRSDQTKSAAAPPASVSALWRPWRNLRLS